MKLYTSVLLAVLATFLFACSDDSSSNNSTPTQDTGNNTVTDMNNHVPDAGEDIGNDSEDVGDDTGADCVDGDTRPGTTACGEGDAGVLNQICTSGTWEDTTECLVTGECTSGEKIGDACWDGRGFDGQLCIQGAWSDAHACRVAEITRASGGVDGGPATHGGTDNPMAHDAVLSFNGEFIAFYSNANNLVADDTNGKRDVFVRQLSTGVTTRVSVNTAGDEGDNDSSQPEISNDGRYILFRSSSSNFESGVFSGFYIHDRQTSTTTHMIGGFGNATLSGDGHFIAFSSTDDDLVTGDTNGVEDIFVLDIDNDTTTRVNVTSDGTQSTVRCLDPSISNDGRYVVFHSEDATLVPNDTNGKDDVFLHDRQTAQTTRISVATDGSEGTNTSGYAKISGDGNFVSFYTQSNLVPDDTENTGDIYVRDVQNNVTTRVSVSSSGEEADERSGSGRISDDGRFITFNSDATNLVTGDTNGQEDVFVHDRLKSTTTRVNLNVTEEQTTDWFSEGGCISGDGGTIAFESKSLDLIENDTTNSSDIFVVPTP